MKNEPGVYHDERVPYEVDLPRVWSEAARNMVASRLNVAHVLSGSDRNQALFEVGTGLVISGHVSASCRRLLDEATGDNRNVTDWNRLAFRLRHQGLGDACVIPGPGRAGKQRSAGCCTERANAQIPAWRRMAMMRPSHL